MPSGHFANSFGRTSISGSSGICIVIFCFFMKQGHRTVFCFILSICVDIIIVFYLFVNCYSTGFKASAILPTVPWGLPASSGVCLHSSHVAVSACFHHDLYCPPQVRRAYIKWQFLAVFKSLL